MSENKTYFTWRTLNEALSTLPEQQVKDLLDAEITGAKRVKVIERLHQRYNTLRVAREREELLLFSLEKLPSRSEVTTSKTYFHQTTEKQESWLDIIAYERNYPETSQTENSRNFKDAVLPLSNEYSEIISNDLSPKLKNAEAPINDKATIGLRINKDCFNNFDTKDDSDNAFNNLIQIGINDLEKHNEEAIFDALNFFEKKCPYCSKDQYRVGVRDKIEIDHFMPISKGGQNVPWNLIPVCKECNRKKKANLPSLFLDADTFNIVNSYLITVKTKFSKIGIYQFSSYKILENIIIRNKEFLRKNISNNFIIELINHLQIEDKKYIADDLDTSRDLLNDIIELRGIFLAGIISAPFQKICDFINDKYGILISQIELKKLVKRAGWIDGGRISSHEYTTKKHVIYSPKLSHLSKSNLRRIIENDGYINL